MAKKELDAAREMVVLGAGAVIASNEVLLVRAYKNQDIATIKAQRAFYEKLSKTLARYRAADNTQWDSQIDSGYTDTEWAMGLERLVKKDPLNPRGKKPGVKIDPATEC